SRFYSFGGWDTYRAYTGEYPIPPWHVLRALRARLSVGDCEKPAGKDRENVGRHDCDALHESAERLRFHNVTAEPAMLQGKKGLKASISEETLHRIERTQQYAQGLVCIDGLDFSNGVIEAELRLLWRLEPAGIAR